MPPDVIFEDGWILVCDKPSGLVVNRTHTVQEETLQDQISTYLKIADLGIGDRAGIVHRLDRETSGLLVVAKDQKSFDFLQKGFRERNVKKKYNALVHGVLGDKSGVINAPITRGKFGKFAIGKKGEGREAQTEFEVDVKYVFPAEKIRNYSEGLSRARENYLVKHGTSYTLVNVFPKTGRTHQIRVHFKSVGHPVVSDLIYSPAKLLRFDLMWCERLFLHASDLEFFHPKTKKRVKFKSPLPNDLKDAILNLNKI